MIEAQRGEAL